MLHGRVPHHLPPPGVDRVGVAGAFNPLMPTLPVASLEVSSITVASSDDFSRAAAIALALACCCNFARRTASATGAGGWVGEGFRSSAAAVAVFLSFIAFRCLLNVSAYSNAFALAVTTLVERDLRPAGVGGATGTDRGESRSP